MDQVADNIAAIKARLGDSLLVLVHHYQREDVVAQADAVGDSLELSKRAARESTAERIAFCGVHFMAESADLLTSSSQAVFMPDPGAGCPMADMADDLDVTEAWNTLQQWGGGEWLPVVYVNSTASIKALCGRWGGSACTSSNARQVFDWVFSQGKRVFFLPDEHLGRNSAAALGIPADKVALYDPDIPAGGLDPDRARRAQVVVWKGFCHVHTGFTPDHVRYIRENWPGASIIVHPETPREALELADESGSTSHIIKYVDAAPDGATIFIGTEANLVERLAAKHASRLDVRLLSYSMCPNMYKTSARKLLALLQDWPAENRVQVPAELAVDARKCLDQMLKL